MDQAKGKILSISIAAYNMELYLRQTLDSLIVPDIMDKLEVFIVDDGSTDRTLTIAKEYEMKYPNTFHAIHKENGGYGSTVNYSICHATGKYFRLLDGDDWFETERLTAFIDMLKKINTDIVITPYFRCSDDGKKKEGIKRQTLDVEQRISKMRVDRVFGIWSITYKTELVKKCNIELPLHCLYTDQIYSTVPFALAKTIRFADIGLYCYRIGRDGQSISKESRIKYVQDHIKVSDILHEFYETQKAKDNENLSYIRRRGIVASWNTIRSYLFYPISLEIIRSLEKYDKKVKSISKDIYRGAGSILSCKKIAIYLWLMRACRYGMLGFLFSKMILPSDGLENRV